MNLFVEPSATQPASRSRPGSPQRIISLALTLLVDVVSVVWRSILQRRTSESRSQGSNTLYVAASRHATCHDSQVLLSTHAGCVSDMPALRPQHNSFPDTRKPSACQLLSPQHASCSLPVLRYLLNWTSLMSAGSAICAPRQKTSAPP